MRKAKSINGILMLITNDYCWEVLKENDGSEVLKITLGDNFKFPEYITLLYTKNILSMRYFYTTFNGEGDTFFINIDFKYVSSIIEGLLKAHKLTLPSLYHINTIELIEYDT